MFSTVSIAKPRFECYWEVSAAPVVRRPKADSTLLGLFGTGFGLLEMHQKKSLSGFMNQLPSIRKVVLQIDEYHWTYERSPALVEVLNRRNHIQWCLLSLRSKVSSDDSDEHQILYRAIIIAALIFSDMVMFPLGPALGHRGRLADMLKTTLDDGPRFNLNITIWLLTIGGIAAMHTHHDAWFVREFVAKTAGILHSTSIPFFHKVMAQFLWWDVECLDNATIFWTRACALKIKSESP